MDGKWTKNAQKAQNGPKLTRSEPKWTKMDQNGPRWTKMDQNRPKNDQDS